MKIVITHAYSLEQKGDSALLIGTIKQLTQTFTSADITAQFMGHAKPGQTYQGAKLNDSLVYLALVPDRPKWARPLHMAYTLAASLLWAGMSRLSRRSQSWWLAGDLRRSCDAMYAADLIVPVAGGYIAANGSTMSTVNLIFILLPLWVAHSLRKPVIHYAQSIGPLGNRFQRWMVRRTLKRARLVITRESVSTEFARGLGVQPAKLRQSVDVGFLFQPADFPLEQAFDDGAAPDHMRAIVGVTTKVHYTGEAQARYERELAKFCDWAVNEKHMQVVFVPQITSPELRVDDRTINRRIYDLMRHPKGAFLIDRNLSNYETKAVIEQLDYMVGTRFHGVIFALTGYVPSIAIEYEHKTRGIMSDLGLLDWVVQMKSVTAAQLEALFDRLIPAREDYVAQLHRNLPPYLAQADEARAAMAKAYQAHKGGASVKALIDKSNLYT